MFKQLPAGSRIIHARQYAWIRCRVDDPVYFWNDFEVARVAYIAMHHRHAESLQSAPIRLGPWAHEVVDAPDRQALDPFEQTSRQRAAGKPANTCNQRFHATTRLDRFIH